jgi:16S rRNA (guanine966-N2)-methyltransferase
MRIVGGQWGGRRLKPPARMPHTRPTTDVAKEGLFNVIENNLDLSGIRTLDLFGGTGAISYELASRGARDLTIIEKDPQMAQFIESNIATLGIENARVIRMDVFKYLGMTQHPFQFIFAGPPYALNTIDQLPALVFEKRLLDHKGWFVLEHTPRNDYKNFPFYRAERKYGTTIFSIFTEDREDKT